MGRDSPSQLEALMLREVASKCPAHGAVACRGRGRDGGRVPSLRSLGPLTLSHTERLLVSWLTEEREREKARAPGRAAREGGARGPGPHLCLLPLLTRSSMSRMGVASSCSRLFSGGTGRGRHMPPAH